MSELTEQLKTENPEDALKAALKTKLRRQREVTRELNAEPHGPTVALVAVTGDQLRSFPFPLRPPLFYRGDTVVFRAGHIGEIYAIRGIGKTWLLQSLALAASAGGEALGFRAPAPCRVLYVDGEMSSADIKERFTRLSEMTGLPLTARLVIIGADWQTDYLPRLDTVDGQLALEPFVEQADLVILDNRSCLFDPEGEKDATAWQPTADWLLSLRRRSKASLLAHHANRQGGARGHSKAEDPFDLLLSLTRPADYTPDQGARFIVEFVKTRGFTGPAAAPFIAHLTPRGWGIARSQDKASVSEKIIQYLILAAKLNESPTSSNKVCASVGGKRQTTLNEFQKLVETGAVKRDEEERYVVTDKL